MAHRPCQPLIFLSPFPRTNVAHHYPPCCTQYYPFASRCGSHKPPKSTSNPLDTCPSATPQSCSRTFHGWEYLSISSARLGERLYLSTSSNNCSYPNDFAKQISGSPYPKELTPSHSTLGVTHGNPTESPMRTGQQRLSAIQITSSVIYRNHLSFSYPLT